MIEICQPELETVIHQRMATGRYKSVEDLLLRSLEASSEPQPQPVREESLVALFAEVRSLFADGELDFSRNPSYARPVDLA